MVTVKTSFTLLALTALVIASSVQAAEFDPNYLISDAEITNYNSMDTNDIQRFLDKREGTLKNYVTVDNDGQTVTAAETFYKTALNALINPKYLLVLVQKEMSLLDDVSPQSSQYDFATGYGCPDGGSCSSRWQGFFKQVNSAALQTRDYVDNYHQYYYQPGVTRIIDDTPVTPKNPATAGLYSYTPHIDCGGNCGGNKLFWNLWNKYFGKKWPDGSLLQAENSATRYYIENGAKREIASKAVFLSRFDAKKIITVTEDDLNYYDDGPPIQYLNFSLLRNPAQEIYMIIDDIKRKIESADLLKQIGLTEDEIIGVSDEELALYKTGPNITKYTIYPTGKLLQNKKNGEIYYILAGKKKLVLNKEIMNANFYGTPVEKVEPADLDMYSPGNPMTLPDGELIKINSSNTVYAVANGYKLPIFNAKIFLAMNYKWTNIITVSQETLAIHQLGQTITGDW
ncbi:MAG: hypothetical protein A3B89_01955 [Candidatus Buchananbacteria bacterium RIFCSPHIGHO2_02_FULL_40_13]|uniref:Curculin domain protein (Mannose-binding) lectin n=1 Tax=Candidatus Buchananbacteria bacterium RIFCSPLOWO2_01_FULL_39_33 TaxID=1797543 RepID=A0A1G1YL49_9BACT|nr:MAG: hypothetical protein A3B89_01955 [Candidatus Buchananbacteria bacterium RIFCSPHIGHO2_02_FULL_40_13]OGY53078.1 MAG: hypothetical protein A3A02_04910 [Candidatus Buchananbacteria bacterium RIFCSPLOWO2_01_FULL_39_33]